MEETAIIKPEEVIEDIVIDGIVMNAPLSDEERLEYNARIARILEGFQIIARASLEMWRDLKYIKDHRLYREKYDNFHDFCAKELGKDNSQVYRYLKDAEIKEELLLEAETDEERLSIMSLKESNTRFIRRLPEDVQLPLWKVAYGIGITVLPKKDDGSIEPTTGFFESVANRVDEIITEGGVNLDGEFISIDKVKIAADSAGTDEDTVKTALLSLGVSEEYLETLERQKDKIREKSMKVDYVPIKGIVETKIDINGSEYPVLIDSKGNEVDLNDLLLSFNNRFINLSIKSPIE